ncbi:MAG TPA: PSD1 and planctomycete cytochrome C domain-containing protein [Candidatus Sulfotelmatobacter sp.]|nr:PSD1 and planctomycete cytochrome C domain-containing protein [Candidatus Sulfotelmatobacter sp.]
MSSGRRLAGSVIVVLIASGLLLAAFRVDLRSRDEVHFSRDIRPILNQNCMPCHGGVRQKNGVSFLFREEALGTGKSGRRTIVPGDPGTSELIARVTSSDPETRMPYHAAPLPQSQIDLLRRWIKQGAKWEDHWAFVAPKPQPLPKVKRAGWIRRPLDQFILARLEKENLEPSAEADKSELLRRAALDLTGLSPTYEEQTAFLSDSSPDAYEKQVDRLLASPRYGERWASMWLDLARYADSKGYEADRDRPGVWPYRDWVIDAYNRNVPYDQFVIKQLAGDLLPDATFEDLIATSFHRQTPNNDEGGTDDEEFRTVAVMDRSATTWSVLNGLTINCVQCHSHPYDPIRHAEYYKSLAFFNTSQDADLPEDTPVLHVPKDKVRYTEASQLQREIAKLRQNVVDQGRQIEGQSEWTPVRVTSATASEALASLWQASEFERELARPKDKKLTPKKEQSERKDLLEEIAEKKKEALAKGGKTTAIQIRDGNIEVGPDVPGKVVYELTARLDVAAITAFRIEVDPANAETARHTPEPGFILDRIDGWIVRPGGEEKKIAFRYVVPDFESDLESAIADSVNHKRGLTDDPGANGFRANPNLFHARWIVCVPAGPLQLTSGSRLKLRLTQTQEITDKPARLPRASLSVSEDARWSELIQDGSYSAKLAELTTLTRELKKIPSVELPVMAEEPVYDERDTLEFERGNFLIKIGPALAPDVPGIFPRLPEGVPRNRLTLAKWFFSPAQPLTARTAVNRYWKQLFGTGIVETLENFGSVGEEPSHPELLDWLALHFQNDLHWDQKALLREIVTSATYRQSAKSTSALTERDPRNRLLARGPQQRLTAEMVRDQALMASGLLSSTMGGQPVMPPQPAGVWNSVYNDSKWVDATGPDRYRRAVYTYIKRTSGYPSFLTFDASDHDTSLARRIPTNTPLQALVTLNDPVYQEAAEALARRMLNEKQGLDAELEYGARLVLSRDPTEHELTTLRSFYQKASAMPALRLASTATHDSARDLAAMTAVASVLLNLDAALTR